MLERAVLTSTQILCFRAKIRKIGIPLHTLVLLYKSGDKGVYITRTCFPDDIRSKLGFASVLSLNHYYRNTYDFTATHMILSDSMHVCQNKKVGKII